MNLLASPTGHLASFSTDGVAGDVNIEGRVASLRQHGDNIVIAEIGGCVNSSEIDFAQVAKAVVGRYGDEFDFLFMTSNLASIRDNQRYRWYHGLYLSRSEPGRRHRYRDGNPFHLRPRSTGDSRGAGSRA